MATPLYFPDPIKSLPTPRFVEPQSNTGVIAAAAGLKALTDVANNFRQKEDSIAKAQSIADALEVEGMQQEANLYRAAAQNYRTNFFATPEENERFNSSLLNDTLKLLTNKQDRELKAQMFKADEAYRSSTLGLQRDRITNDQAELQIRSGERADALAERTQRNKVLGIQASEDNVRSRMGQVEAEIQRLTSLRRQGGITQQDYSAQSAPLVDEYNNLQNQLAELRQSSFNVQGIETPVARPSQRDIPLIKSEQEELEERKAKADAEFKKHPNLEKAYGFFNPNYVPAGSSTERIVEGPTGRTVTRETRTPNLPIDPDATIKGRYGLPPGAPVSGTGTQRYPSR